MLQALETSDAGVTLVTKPSYLPGVIVLAHSLDKHESVCELLVQYTLPLGDEYIQSLKRRADAQDAYERKLLSCYCHGADRRIRRVSPNASKIRSQS
jgi:hypothetical protein